MPTAELNIKTTHDGTQAERSIDRLEGRIKQFGDSVGDSISKKLMNFFSAGALIGFAKAAGESVDKVGALVDKLKEGKQQIEEIQKQTGLSRSDAGALAGISEAGNATDKQNAGYKARAIRAFYGIVSPLFGGPLWNENLAEKAAYALYGDRLGTLGVAQQEGKLSLQKARLEKIRQETIKQIVDREMSDKPEADGPGTNFSTSALKGRYFGPGIPDQKTLLLVYKFDRQMELERQSLEVSKKILRALDRGGGPPTTFPQ